MSEIIKTYRPAYKPECPAVRDRRRIQRELGDFLMDESRTEAEGVDVIFFPENIDQLSAAVAQCRKNEMKVSVSGARTGIAGGAVPVESDAVISLGKMNVVHGLNYRRTDGEDAFSIRVEAGLILSQLQEALKNTNIHELPWDNENAENDGIKVLEHRKGKLFYPVDPTEVSAQIGGTVATNASGARSYFYGPTRHWVEAVKVVTASGEIAELQRGQCTANQGRFTLIDSSRNRQTFRLPRDLNMPKTKNTAGYYIPGQNMDAVDLFIGSEGTLGIIAETTLRLTFEPPERLFANVYLKDESAALDFVEAVRDLTTLNVLAIEYTDPHALELLRGKRRRDGASGGVPRLPDGCGCVVYTEIAFDGDEEFKECYDLLEPAIKSAGGSAENTWASFSPTQMQAMKDFRHAVPEAVNTVIAERKRVVPEIHKIGTDMAVPDAYLRDVLKLYHRELEASGLQHVIFGHIGDNHLHVNILPETAADVEKAKKLYQIFAQKIVTMGGSVSAEHGIGRIKKELLRMQYCEGEMGAMHAVKQAFDPDEMLNRGVIF